MGRVRPAEQPAEFTVIRLRMARVRVMRWNGRDIPEELRELPAGAYVVEAVDDAGSLTSEEEQGIAQALRSLRVGNGRAADQVRQTIESILRK
jgi:hypothetical protein